MSLRQRRHAQEVVAVMVELAVRPRQTGFELHRASGIRLGRIYRILDQLLADGVVTAKFVGGREPRRREYRLSASSSARSRL